MRGIMFAANLSGIVAGAIVGTFAGWDGRLLLAVGAMALNALVLVAAEA